MEESAGTTTDDVDDQSPAQVHPNASLQPLLDSLLAGGSISEFWNAVKAWSEENIQLAAHDTIPAVYKLLVGDYTEKGSKDVEVVEQLLGHFVDVCEPKEFMLLLIEQAQESWTGCRFLVTVPAVGRCISRIPPPRVQSVTFAVDAFAGYLETLPVPSVDNLEGRERMLVDADPMVHRICVVFAQFLEFARPMVKEVSQNIVAKENRVTSKEVEVLSSSLLKLVDRPLGHLDLTGRRHKRSEPRILAEECLSLLSFLHRDFVRLVSDIQNNVEMSSNAGSQSADDGKSKERTQLNVSTFAFLAFGERAVPKCLPHVYSHQFFLEFCAPMIVVLFKEQDLFPALHGIQFCASVLSRIDPESLTVDVLESDDLQRLALAVIQRAATSRTKELGSSMLRLLSTMCRVLEPAARNHYLYILLKVSPRTGGVVGHVIGMISDEIVNHIGRAENHFAGVELERLLQLVFALPSGEKTDLMENSERIMAALKLLRVVLPLDRMSDNRTGIWNLIPVIERNYLRTLHAAIELSKSHYELEIRRTREQRSKDVTGPCDGGDARLTRRQQLGVYEMAVHTLEMMESVASQVGSVIEAARKDDHAVVTT